MSLTEPQANVVATKGHCSCIALPGSGKSHTCVHHVAVRLDTIPNCYYQAISFTRKAANELRERIIGEVGLERYQKQVNVSTFDSIFIKQLQRANNGKRINIMSNAERHNLVMRSLRHLGMTKMKVDDAKMIIDQFGGYIEIPKALATEKPQALELYKQFEEFRREKKMWDFPSISKVVVKGQETGAIPLLNITHLQVDEFQDTNGIQYRWLKQYRESNIEVLTVGDDDQSVYSFRGSSGYQNFINFKEDFKPKMHVLNTCFRCKPGILFTAKSLIENNIDRVEKDMKSIAGKGGMVKLHSARTDPIELEEIALHLMEQDNHSEWAVLARTNLRLWNLAGLLTAMDVPFRTKETESILCAPFSDIVYKIAKSYLTENKVHAADILSWLGCTEAQILESRETGGLSRRYSMVNYELDDKELPETTDERLFVTWRDLISGSYSLDEGIKKIEMLISGSKPLSKGEARLLDIITTIMRSTKQETFKDCMKVFCKMVEKSQKSKEEDTSDQEGVELLTLHSSKGLQWKNVWIMGCTLGQIPAPAKNPDDYDESEERRLLFVGMTRAMDKLYMSYKELKESNFIEEIRPYLESDEYRHWNQQ